ncbi:fatty acid cis/trans isomerase [Thalassolituus sp. ST750PaO-4]|uniref:fatty acid cis/trans isomerase n=1 Tax=Thalassolituus sp. ST750PaO-4 TaxID=2742965 RepID=UPI001CE380C4|nr:fatty acid cis/trans isomerase [Thalassolituus sp. ST750PaO-4]MCA6058402.1 fatty acid cis/trans isomerase [Thalassolituus sp. ST750PaO-4]
MSALLRQRFPRLYRLFKPGLLTLLIAGCATVGVGLSADELFGKTVITDRRAEANSSQARHYRQDIRPILENRCVVCHGCYDAPCQLKLSSPEGIMRGANKTLVYDGTRILASEPTRLGIDARTTEEWRKKDFFPVINERSQTAEINLQNSVLYQMLTLKANNPLPAEKLLDDDDFELGLNRSQQCPTQEEFAEYADKHPLWGMPYALPALSNDEYSKLTQWLKDGAALAADLPLPDAIQAEVEHWEAFLNQDNLKQQLTSRYIYEHLFLASLYFSPEPLFRNQQPINRPEYFFKLVRSSTPPGLPINPVATRRPYDDPQVKRVYYRLLRDSSSVVAKTHMPYRLNNERMDWIKALFIEPEYKVDYLPDYKPETAANPFIAFSQLPVNARYRFMLEESEYIITGFIKGPVCRGQVALNVIDDHFWVFFVDPEMHKDPDYSQFLIDQSDHLRLPGEAESNSGIITNWLRYSSLHNEYLDAKNVALAEKFPDGNAVDLNLIWRGNNSVSTRKKQSSSGAIQNANAALTIFRHFDSSTVVKGMVGQHPKTAWVINYSLLERIHYLLVAEFDVYGNIGHQLMTRLYMDFLRMEGESNFLALLPQEERVRLANYWYRDASDSVKQHLVSYEKHILNDPAITYHSQNPQAELYEKLRQHLQPVLEDKYNLARRITPQELNILSRVNRVQGQAATLMPEISLLLVENMQGDSQVFTLIRNSGHSNLTGLLYEEENRLPQEDYLTLVPGIIGSYPSAYYRVSSFRLNDFVSAVSGLTDEDDYEKLADRFSVRRTDPQFWTHSDQIHQWYLRNDPLNAGLLDYNRLENR